jgi:hypothetical protein
MIGQQNRSTVGRDLGLPIGSHAIEATTNQHAGNFHSPKWSESWSRRLSMERSFFEESAINRKASRTRHSSLTQRAI